jgi:ABC-2 type transport system permease protein
MARVAFGLVVRREIRERVRQRSFLVATGLSIALIIIVSALPTLLDQPTRLRLAVTDERSEAIARTAVAFLRQDEPDARVWVARVRSLESGREAVRRGAFTALVTTDADGEPSVVVHRSLDDSTRVLLDVAILRQRAIDDAAAAGVSPEVALRIITPRSYEVDTIDPPDPEREADTNLARAAAIILFIQVLQFGMAVATGIIEEKQSRVLELLLGRMRPRTLLAGKLFGIGAVGLFQTSVLVAVGLSVAHFSGAIDVGGASFGLAAWVLLWFVLGYAVYSSLFLIAGALAGRQEDLQSTSSVATMVSLVSYIFSVIALVNPAGAVARWVSMLPMTAPLAMPVRIASGEARLGEIVASIVLTVVTIAVFIRFAAWMYVRTMLSPTQQSLVGVLRRRAGSSSVPLESATQP